MDSNAVDPLADMPGAYDAAREAVEAGRLEILRWARGEGDLGGRPGSMASRRAGSSGSPPTIWTPVATTEATVPDAAMTEPVHDRMAAVGLLPAEHAADAGYTSAGLLLDARARGITLPRPLLSGSRRRPAPGIHRRGVHHRLGRPAGELPAGRHQHRVVPVRPAAERQAIVVRFATAACRACPGSARCTTSRTGRQFVPAPPRDPPGRRGRPGRAIGKHLDRTRTTHSSTGLQPGRLTRINQQGLHGVPRRDETRPPAGLTERGMHEMTGGRSATKTVQDEALGRDRGSRNYTR